MSSILSLNKETAPLSHALREAVPFQNFFFKYNIERKPEGGSTAVHIVRSGVTITACSAFILAGLVEKAVRFILGLIKSGIDKVLSKQQQDNIKDKAGDAAEKAKDAGKGFFSKYFAPLFS